MKASTIRTIGVLPHGITLPEHEVMTETDQETTSRRRYVVVGPPNRYHLHVGTLLEERRRFEGWDYQGCIDPVCSIVAVMSVVSGPRAGEMVEITLESGYEHEPPFSKAAWLVAVPNE